MGKAVSGIARAADMDDRASGKQPGRNDRIARAVIVQRVDAQTRAKTGVNELLRD